eukprot:73445_1
MENAKSISQLVTDIDFQTPNNPTAFILPEIKQNEDFHRLLQISCHNKNDLGSAMFTQYEQSNLQSNKYIQLASLFHEIGNEKNIQNMFQNYIISHEKDIYKPIPSTPNQLPPVFNDNMNIIIQYQIEVQKLIDSGVINASTVHLDTFFVPPHSCEFANMEIRGMVVDSKPVERRYRSGLNEIDLLFRSKKGKQMMHDINDCKKRLILMIVRGNAYDTNDDILYLFTQKIPGNLKEKQYEYNQVLWNINTKKDINIDIKTKHLFNISYYLNTQKQWKIYMQYYGYGQRVFKHNIMQKWNMLFRNGINVYNDNKLLKLIQEFKDYAETDISIQYGKCLFGLKYQTKIFQNIANQKYVLSIPKNVLKNERGNIREDFADQKQCYYYLMWTCKMQIFDKQFIHYIFEDKQIGIFNCELHNKHSNSPLYVVCELNEKTNNWTMLNMMTQYYIHYEYGIINLPIGSREKHNSFIGKISENYDLILKCEIMPIDYTKLDVIRPKSSVYNIDKESKKLMNYIKNSINNINSKQHNMSLIPILHIDLYDGIYCETLIPIQIPNEQSYMGVSYKTIGNKIEIKSIYTDCNEILNKATLVNPNAYDAYKYLISNNNNNNIYNNDNDKKDNILLKKLASDQSWRIESLQKELQAALQREHLLLSMLMQTKANANVCMPITPALFNYNSDSPSLPPFQPILYNNSNNSNNSNTSNNSNSYSNSPPLSSYQATITNFNFCIGK